MAPHSPLNPSLQAMLQWADEIERCTKPDTLRVLSFYNKREQITAAEIQQADVVLTTYAVVEYDYRRIVDEHKVPCQYCGKRLLPRSLVWSVISVPIAAIGSDRHGSGTTRTFVARMPDGRSSRRSRNVVVGLRASPHSRRCAR